MKKKITFGGIGKETGLFLISDNFSGEATLKDNKIHIEINNKNAKRISLFGLIWMMIKNFKKSYYFLFILCTFLLIIITDIFALANNPIKHQTITILGALYEMVTSTIFILLFMAFLNVTKFGKSLFEFHGVEHKTITAYERYGKITTKNILNSPKEHMRCGTCLLPLLIIIQSMLILVQPINSGMLSMVITLFGSITIMRIARHAPMSIQKIVCAPGMWIQKIFATREPNLQQIEVGRLLMTEMLRMEELNEKNSREKSN